MIYLDELENIAEAWEEFCSVLSTSVQLSIILFLSKLLDLSTLIGGWYLGIEVYLRLGLGMVFFLFFVLLVCFNK